MAICIQLNHIGGVFLNRFLTVFAIIVMCLSMAITVFANDYHEFVKEDLLPFVRNPKELDIWSNDYFVLLADMVRIE